MQTTPVHYEKNPFISTYIPVYLQNETNIHLNKYISRNV
jgi:hypothetical protein